MIDISAHRVTAIELVNTFIANHNQRVIRITTEDGSFEICLWGETDVLDALPKSEDFSVSQFQGAA